MIYIYVVRPTDLSGGSIMSWLGKLFRGRSKSVAIEPAAKDSTAGDRSGGETVATHRGQPAAGDIGTIVSSLTPAPWNDHADVVKLKDAIKKTFGVDCQVLSLPKSHAETLARLAPLDAKFRDTSDQYQITLSGNSIFIHAHGAFVDLGYVMFVHNDNLCYVNVEPTVQLVKSIFNRKDDLSYMAKIMIVLNKHIGAGRATLLVRLKGRFSQSSG